MELSLFKPMVGSETSHRSVVVALLAQCIALKWKAFTGRVEGRRVLVESAALNMKKGGLFGGSGIVLNKSMVSVLYVPSKYSIR